ncbi:lysophospholipid acyltransferase family protein [Salinispira pacifica]
MAKRTQRRERLSLDTYKLLNIILRNSVGLFIRYRYRVRSSNLALVRKLQPPYLLLPNHMSFWDPFFLGAVVRHPVYYVTSDAHFRSRVLNFLLGLVGAIPKTKVLSDFETVRTILRVRRDGGIVGIYPEGRRTWDGTTLPLYYSMAKLIRLLRVPVVAVISSGAFMSLPRWARTRRKGEVRLGFKLSLTAEEAGSLSQDEIFERISADLDYNEYDFQQQERLRFRSRRPAEKLEQVLHECPNCEAIGGLFSRDRRLRCVSCGYTVTVDDYGFLHAAPGMTIYYDTVHGWNEWQSEQLIRRLKQAVDEGPGNWGHEKRPIFRRGHITMYTGYRSQPLRRHPPGVLSFHVDGLLYRTHGGRSLLFPFSGMSGVNVQNQERIEFYYEGTLYSFQTTTRQLCSYQWANGVTVMRAIERGEGDQLSTLADIQVRQQEGRLRLPKRPASPAGE